MPRPKKDVVQETNSPIKRLRLNADLSQEKLARQIGVAVSTIRRWEKGQCEPTLTLNQVRLLCQASGISFEMLPDKLSFPLL